MLFPQWILVSLCSSWKPPGAIVKALHALYSNTHKALRRGYCFLGLYEHRVVERPSKLLFTNVEHLTNCGP